MKKKSDVKFHKKYIKNPCRYNDDIIEIPMNNPLDDSTMYTLIDKANEHLLAEAFHAIKCITSSGKTSFYAASGKNLTLAELVMGCKAPKGKKIDHINGNTLDNRRCNLRIVSNSLNAQNSKKRADCTSKYIGVYLVEETWRACIRLNGKTKTIGSFKTEIAAAKGYDVYVFFKYKDEEGDPKNNGLLTPEEITDIRANGLPEEYIKDNVRELPKCIRLKDNKYRVEVIRGGEMFNKAFLTLDEAIQARDEYINEYNAKKKLEEQERIKTVTRNSNGKAVIYATDGSIKHSVEVSDKTWTDVSSLNWSTVYSNGKPAYFQAKDKSGKSIILHRYLYEKYIGPIPEHLSVDHRNQNKFDNTLENLRTASGSLQAQNKPKLADGINEYKGVSFAKGKFLTTVQAKTHGLFETAEEAALKYNEIVQINFGNEEPFLNVVDLSKVTTKDNRIPSEIVTPDYIRNLKRAVDVRNIATTRNLGIMKYGKGGINLNGICLDNLAETKEKIIELLFN